jgi:hypothetical protein
MRTPRTHDRPVPTPYAGVHALIASKFCSRLLVPGFITLVVAGCGIQPSSPHGSTAVQAWVAPVYRNATFGGTLGSHDAGASEDAQAWFYRTTDPVERVVDFYAHNFPGAQRQNHPDGTVTFRVRPEGAAPGQFLRVTVRPGLIEIREEVRG